MLLTITYKNLWYIKYRIKCKYILQISCNFTYTKRIIHISLHKLTIYIQLDRRYIYV